MTLNQLFEEATEKKASDIHLASGEVPCLRIAGDLVRLEAPPIDREALVDLLEPFLPAGAILRVESGVPVERTVVHGDMAFVGLAFRVGAEGFAATFRMLSRQVPSLDKVGEGAHDLFQSIVEAPRGLVLITGPTGSGKWTTGCSIVEAINLTRAARIFVMEAHPNFRFESRKGLVTQLHIGEDCESYSRALEIAQQADLDVLAIDDIPTADALRQALILADTGHLVIANMHADGIVDAARRLEEAAGGNPAAFRRSLAQNLLAITGQRLFKRNSGSGRVPAYEWVTATTKVREAILSGDYESLSQPQDGCQTLGEALNSLVSSGSITEETAMLYR